MEISNALFEKLLANNNLKKNDFAEYSKIPYDTVAGWKKRNVVPSYAMVILKDMIYRQKLELDTKKEIQKNFSPTHEFKYRLTKHEEARLKSVFWGTNYTIGEVAQKIRERNKTILQALEENLPFRIQKQIVDKLSHA